MAHILVVDDEESIRLTLATFLSNASHQVETAEDVPVALERLKAGSFDVVVSDIIMPRATGVELLQTIHQESPRVQVIMMTGQPTLETAAAAVRAGAFDYLTKPVPKDAILRCVANAAKLKATEDERARQAEVLERQHKLLQDSYNRLRELEAQRDDLTHMIIHDLRSPLALITGYADLINGRTDSKLSTDATGFMNTIHRSAEKALEMISTILDVSRMEENRMPLKRTLCDLAAVAQVVATSYGTLANQCRLSVEAAPKPIVVHADMDILQRIIANMVGNAVKFTPRGGDIHISVNRKDSMARLAVKDTGLGIPAELRAKIFEKFGQADRHVRKHSSGLGLAFCKLAVEAHGGKIGVDSTVGEGSTFWFELAIADHDLSA